MVKSVYTYLVLFATLMMVIGGTIGIFRGLSDYLFPNPYYETFDSYELSFIGGESKDEDVDYKYTSEEIKLKYDNVMINYIDQERERAKRLILISFGWVLIPLPVFLYYQFSLRRKSTVLEEK